MKLLWTLKYLYTIVAVGNQQYFTLNCIKPTYIHHFQVPNIEIVAMENLHLNVYFTKQYKLTTENALPVYKQTL